MLDPEVMRMPGWRGGDGNAAYLDKTLRHHDIELDFDESVGSRAFLAVFFQAFSAALAAFLVFAFFMLLFLLAKQVEAALTVLVLGLLVAAGVFTLVLLLIRYVEPIAEWRVLLADRWDTADTVYIQIIGVLRQRNIPIRHDIRRFRTGLGGNGVSNRLTLNDSSYTAYVSVFPYGTSLYLGWMMWRSRRGHRLIAQFFKDIITGILGRNSPEYQMLRTERPRAMREALHAVCREGLMVGVERRQVPVAFGFPQGMPPVTNDPMMPDAPPPSSMGWTGESPHPPPDGHGPQPGQVPPSSG